MCGLIIKNKKCPVWSGGDFKLPDIDWEIRSEISHQYPKHINDKFIEVIDDCYLEQLVTFPIRATNTLDLLLTNRASLLNRCKSTAGFGHHISSSDIQCHPQLPKPIQPKI